MLRRLFSTAATSLCVALATLAMTTASGLSHAQEAAQTPPTESTGPANTEPSKDEAVAEGDKPAKEEPVAEKPAEEPAEKPAEAQKPEAQKPEEQADAEKEEDKPEDSEKEKEDSDKAKEDKGKKAEKPQPRKLPRIGRVDGPLLPGQKWRVHDMYRPHPPVVTPGELSTYDKPGTPPSDAIVLFDGKDLSNWCHVDPEDRSELIEAQWKVQDGYFEVTPGTPNMMTIDSFGSCQLHVEWQTPAPGRGDSQNRGNSGIFLMDSFEVQVLDSFKNRSYADGQAGAMYGQYPPMVNASREPGQWQVYDILFEAPVISTDGKVETPAKLTLMHNGVYLHNRREYYGPTGGGVVPQYRTLSPAAPIRLQNHGSPVRYRNIWVRPLPALP